MLLKAEGLPMVGAGDVQEMTIRDGIHPDGEDRVIIRPEAARVLLTEVLRVHPGGAIRVPPAAGIPVLPEVIPVHPTGAIPAHREKAILVLQEEAIPVLPAVAGPVAIPARSAMPAGSSPAVAAGRAMPVILPAVAVATQVKDNLVI